MTTNERPPCCEFCAGKCPLCLPWLPSIQTFREAADSDPTSRCIRHPERAAEYGWIACKSVGCDWFYHRHCLRRYLHVIDRTEKWHLFRCPTCNRSVLPMWEELGGKVDVPAGVDRAMYLDVPSRIGVVSAAFLTEEEKQEVERERQAKQAVVEASRCTVAEAPCKTKMHDAPVASS